MTTFFEDDSSPQFVQLEPEDYDDHTGQYDADVQADIDHVQMQRDASDLEEEEDLGVPEDPPVEPESYLEYMSRLMGRW